MLLLKHAPTIAGPVYHTSGISEILHIIMEPSLALSSHITKDSFNFKNRLDKHCLNGITRSTCDVKLLYTNIRHDLFYTAIAYWIQKLQIIYHYCDVSINNLSLKACPLF